MALLSDFPFDKPVEVWTGTGTSRVVASTRDAAETLLNRWPGNADAANHRAARKACLDVLQGARTALVARRAFAAAAKEAGILKDK